MDSRLMLEGRLSALGLTSEKFCVTWFRMTMLLGCFSAVEGKEGFWNTGDQANHKARMWVGLPQGCPSHLESDRCLVAL